MRDYVSFLSLTSSAFFAAPTLKLDMVSPPSVVRIFLLAIPVRVRIHSSLVSTSPSIWTFDSDVEGVAEPTPTIRVFSGPLPERGLLAESWEDVLLRNDRCDEEDDDVKEPTWYAISTRAKNAARIVAQPLQCVRTKLVFDFFFEIDFLD